MAGSDLHSVMTVATLLGVPKTWVQRALRSGAIQAQEFNSMIRFDPADAPAWHRAIFDVELAHMPTDDGLVYFIAPEKKANGQKGIPGPIKIGVSKDPKQRLMALQTSSPVRLRVLATMPGGSRREQELHYIFSRSRLHGEWFAPSDALSMVISEAMLCDSCAIEPEAQTTVLALRAV